MHILTANISKTETDTATIAIANSPEGQCQGHVTVNISKMVRDRAYVIIAMAYEVT